MDYLGWELERQRAVLTALLLGGGEAQDGEAVPDGERRSPAEPEAARGNAAGQAGRYAGGGRYSGAPTGGASEFWETVREARQGRLPQGTGSVKPPVSAWEAVLGAETGYAAQGGRGDPFVLRQAFQEEGQGPLSEGTGTQAELSPSSGGYAGRTGRQASAAGNAAETAMEAAAAAGERRVGERRAESVSDVWGAAGTDAAVRQFRWTPVVRHASPVRQIGGGPAETLEQGEAPDEIGLWGGGWGSAALQPEDSAKALSRAVQRDARRYDGGFTIY